MVVVAVAALRRSCSSASTATTRESADDLGSAPSRGRPARPAHLGHRPGQSRFPMTRNACPKRSRSATMWWRSRWSMTAGTRHERRRRALEREWEAWDPGVPLRVLRTEYASVVEPMSPSSTRARPRATGDRRADPGGPRPARYRVLHNHVDRVLTAGPAAPDRRRRGPREPGPCNLRPSGAAGECSLRRRTAPSARRARRPMEGSRRRRPEAAFGRQGLVSSWPAISSPFQGDHRRPRRSTHRRMSAWPAWRAPSPRLGGATPSAGTRRSTSCGNPGTPLVGGARWSSSCRPTIASAPDATWS